MGIAANPPPQSRLPVKLTEDDELRFYFTALQEDMYRLWLRSGGGTDQVSDITVNLDVINARLDAIELRLDAIDIAIFALQARVTYLEGLTVVTAIDYTIDGGTTGHQTVVCTADVTIKLDPSPTDRDTAIIKVGQKNTKVVIDGNGKLIEEDTTMTLRRLNTSRQIAMDLEYSEELDRWFTT